MQILDRQIAALLLDVVLHEVDLALRHDEPVTDVIAGWARRLGLPVGSGLVEISVALRMRTNS